MALQGSYTDRHGVTHSSAYARIERFTFNRDTILCSVKIYSSAAARLAGNDELIEVREVLINDEGNAIALLENVPNILSAAYNRLRNVIPKFSGWISV